jgi:hypothetical protein
MNNEIKQPSLDPPMLPHQNPKSPADPLGDSLHLLHLFLQKKICMYI